MPTIKLQNGKVVLKDGKVSCDCCTISEVCITKSFFISGLEFPQCQTIPYGETTVVRPTGIVSAPAPVPVRIRGFVDDDLLLNGEITQPGEFPFNLFGFVCNQPHEVTVDFTLINDSFTIAAGDNFGANAWYELTICFGGDPLDAP